MWTGVITIILNVVDANILKDAIEDILIGLSGLFKGGFYERMVEFSMVSV